jgi:hypothetical protein
MPAIFFFAGEAEQDLVRTPADGDGEARLHIYSLPRTHRRGCPLAPAVLGRGGAAWRMDGGRPALADGRRKAAAGAAPRGPELTGAGREMPGRLVSGWRTRGSDGDRENGTGEEGGIILKKLTNGPRSK